MGPWSKSLGYATAFRPGRASRVSLDGAPAGRRPTAAAPGTLSLVRDLTDAARLGRLMEGIGRQCRSNGRIYLVGGASAVLVGWRATTVDVDLKLDPEPAGVFEAIAELKDALGINVELAAPDQFIPPLPGWRERSPFIVRHGPVSFHHYDFHSQALAKIARGFGLDRSDVEAMHRLELIEPDTLLALFEAIEPGLERYPAIDPIRFREKVDDAVAWLTGETGNHDNDLEPSP